MLLVESSCLCHYNLLCAFYFSYSFNNKRTKEKRSCSKRLALILPVEEQDGGNLIVRDFDTHSEVCRSPGKAGV